MSDTFVPKAWPKGVKAGERGWIKPGSGKGAGHPAITIKFKADDSSPQETLIEFYITQCADETRHVPSLKQYADAPGGSFIYDARYLVENDPGDLQERARANLNAISEAYEWWKERRTSRRVVFFCVSGQNRSVTSSVVFVLSLLGEVGMTMTRRRASRNPQWLVSATTSNFEESLEYDGTKDTFVHYLLRLVHEIRPIAFRRTPKTWSEQLVDRVWAIVVRTKAEPRVKDAIRAIVEEESDPVLDYTRLWVGHRDNRSILWLLDGAVRARLYADWWGGEVRWLTYELPPMLTVAHPERERVRKRKELASAKEDEDSLITLL